MIQFHPTGTDVTTISYEDGKFVVTGRGGYDGFVRMKFDQIEDAMDYVASLWGINSGEFEQNRKIVSYDKKPLIKRLIKQAFGG